MGATALLHVGLNPGLNPGLKPDGDDGVDFVETGWSPLAYKVVARRRNAQPAGKNDNH